MNYRTSLSLIISAAIAFFCAASALGSSLFEDAGAMFRSKNFGSAAVKYLEVARTEPANAEAAYYAAYASYYAGRKADAIQIFWYVAKKCSSSKHAVSSRELLKKIDSDYAKHSLDPRFASLPGAPSAAVTVAATHVTAPTSPIEDKKKLIDELVQLTPRRSNRPDVTPAFVAEIKDGLNQFSLPILRFLKKHNCHIIVCPCVIEADFRMQGYSPGGYWEGATMEDVPALFDFKNIVIGQYLPDTAGGYRQNDGGLGTIRHEIGHAIDRFSGNLSQKDDFKHARVWDYPYRAEQRAKLAYFLGGGRGDAEAFAELCAFKFGGRTDKRRTETCNLLQSLSARSYPVVEKVLEKLETESP
jgi:hypothetical protein